MEDIKLEKVQKFLDQICKFNTQKNELKLEDLLHSIYSLQDIVIYSVESNQDMEKPLVLKPIDVTTEDENQNLSWLKGTRFKYKNLIFYCIQAVSPDGEFIEGCWPIWSWPHNVFAYQNIIELIKEGKYIEDDKINTLKFQLKN